MTFRYSALITTTALVAGLLLGLAAASRFPFSLGGLQWPANSSQTERFSESSKNVFRIYGSDFYQAGVAISQLVYPGPRIDAHPDAQPGVVILVPSGRSSEPFYAEAMAAAALIHHPRNGPILFTEPNRLNDDVAAELRRLNPKGGADWPQVFLIGRISQSVEDEVKRIGLNTERLSGSDPYETAALVDERVGRPGHVIIVRGDDPSHGLPGVAWIAHMADSSLLFTEQDRLQEATVRALQARQNPFAVHILGPEEYISSGVEQQLQEIAGAQAVTRIAGTDPFSTAVAFARFKQGVFGWGIESAGHGFYFATPEGWQDAVAGALTSHLGGHGPLLLTTREGLPEETFRYLETVRPVFPDGDPTQARLNRGYLIASPEAVSFDQQAEIDWLLESVPQMGERMPGMDGQGH